MTDEVAIVGCGIFGVTAALALRGRGYAVTLLDPGPIPHPLAESTDISKVVRMDYGADETYMALMEVALDRWRAWNASWEMPLFHESGVTFLSRSPLAPGGFEHESLGLLRARGHPVERLDARAIRTRFPAWSEAYVDGYFNPAGGWVESGRVVAQLVGEAERAGVRLLPGRKPARLLEEGGRVIGVVSGAGETFRADWVLCAAGSWTPDLVPWLSPELRAVGQPVFHLAPEDPSPYRAERFPVFGADIAHTGYYGFCANAEGVVKIANHGVGRRMHPDSTERTVTADEEAAFHEFLRGTFPGLASAPIVSTRVCVYCDTWDEHFWIARDPDREGLAVATGGSGHGFKFAPVLGDLIADALEGADDPVLARFRWRPGMRPSRGEEAARFHAR